MALQAETKDCTGLSDSELSEMADICADGTAGYDVGILSKHVEEWVLVTQVRDGVKLSALLLLHARAHRGHALGAHRAGVGEAQPSA